MLNVLDIENGTVVENEGSDHNTRTIDNDSSVIGNDDEEEGQLIEDNELSTEEGNILYNVHVHVHGQVCATSRVHVYIYIYICLNINMCCCLLLFSSLVHVHYIQLYFGASH